MQVYWIRTQDHSDIFSQGYVGVTKHFDQRMKQHNWNHPNPYFANAIAKYGWDNLVKSVVLVADEDYCLDIEQKLRPAKEIGWNIVPGGGKPPVLSGKRPELCGRTPWNKGKKMPQKAVEKVRAAVKLQMQDPSHRAWLSEIKKGMPSPMAGKKHSEEARAKMSASKRGVPSGRLGAKISGQALENVRKASRVQWVCPHCNTVGMNTGAANRWHFNNCKELSNASA
jgi:predicted GIY-YIG superfamily endonuclease/ribosomal protein L37AE/L43A